MKAKITERVVNHTAKYALTDDSGQLHLKSYAEGNFEWRASWDGTLITYYDNLSDAKAVLHKYQLYCVGNSMTVNAKKPSIIFYMDSMSHFGD